MAFLDAIAAFKGAFLGALLGNNVPRNDFGTGYRSGHAINDHHHHHHQHRPHTVRPHAGHTYPTQTNHGRPYPQQHTVHEQPSPYRPTYPLYTLSR